MTVFEMDLKPNFYDHGQVIIAAKDAEEATKVVEQWLKDWGLTYYFKPGLAESLLDVHYTGEAARVLTSSYHLV